jgi:hypothetical protein
MNWSIFVNGTAGITFKFAWITGIYHFAVDFGTEPTFATLGTTVAGPCAIFLNKF